MGARRGITSEHRRRSIQGGDDASPEDDDGNPMEEDCVHSYTVTEQASSSHEERVIVPDLLYRATTSKRGTPIGAAGRGIVRGLTGALLLSIVSRMLPALGARRS